MSPDAAAPVLSFRDVAFAYGKTPVLRRLSVDVGEGEMAAILGPNGSGKTTWVRLAAGTLRPDAGTIRLAGRSLDELSGPERARCVAVVPQDTHLAFDFTVREVVAMGRAPHLGLLGIETDRDREIVTAALEQTEVGALADRPFHSLSGGERQRVIVARSLAQQPRVLLLDEPTTFLDLRHRLSIYDLLTKLNAERGLTVVAVSHDLDLASRYCRRLVLLRYGRVHTEGVPRDVLTRENLRDVYEVESEVLEDPVTGGPRVVPLRPHETP